MTDKLRIGIAGLGTVGAGVVALLAKQGSALAARTGKTIEVTAVSARDRTRDRGFDTSAMRWFDDAVALAASPDIDVFVELIGGEEAPARLAVEAALKAGKPATTPITSTPASRPIAPTISGPTPILAMMAIATSASSDREPALKGSPP